MAAKKKNAHTEKELTVSQAAEFLGVSRQAVFQAIRFGRLESRKLGHFTVIPLSSLRAYKKTRKPAPPRKS